MWSATLCAAASASAPQASTSSVSPSRAPKAISATTLLALALRPCAVSITSAENRLAQAATDAAGLACKPWASERRTLRDAVSSEV